MKILVAGNASKSKLLNYTRLGIAAPSGFSTHARHNSAVHWIYALQLQTANYELRSALN